MPNANHHAHSVLKFSLSSDTCTSLFNIRLFQPLMAPLSVEFSMTNPSLFLAYHTRCQNFCPFFSTIIVATRLRLPGAIPPIVEQTLLLAMNYSRHVDIRSIQIPIRLARQVQLVTQCQLLSYLVSYLVSQSVSWLQSLKWTNKRQNYSMKTV